MYKFLRLDPAFIGPVWLSVLTMGLGGLGTWHYSSVFLKAKSTDYWQIVPGQVVTAEYDYDAITRRSTASFAYRYQIDGQNFDGKRVSWANTGRSGPSLFNARESVNVYVNPDNAKEAVLKPGTDLWTIVQILISLSVFGVGLWLLFLVFDEIFKAQKDSC
ncbi:MAG: DUF3592 domain-containing protein [Cyanobacteria bacterium J06598_3]